VAQLIAIEINCRGINRSWYLLPMEDSGGRNWLLRKKIAAETKCGRADRERHWLSEKIIEAERKYRKTWAPRKGVQWSQFSRKLIVPGQGSSWWAVSSNLRLDDIYRGWRLMVSS
jgi:hypothetical protein